MILEFANFEIDDELFELRRDGAPLPIQRKTFDLLLYLARSGGAVVTREVLMREVWPSVVVSEPALTQAILTVRKALGDDGDDPKIVKTVRGRGYRFVETRVREAARPDRPADRARPRRTPFVGRGPALEHLDDKLASARAGHGRVVLVFGEQGVGKTALLAELASRGEPEAAVRVLRGNAFAGEGAPPLWPWIQIHRRLGGEGEGAPIDETATSQEVFRFGDQLTRRLLERAKDEPLLVILEDVHWADAASLEIVRLLAPQLAHSRMLVVLTARGTAALDKTAGPLGAIARLPVSSSIELGPFGRADVTALVEALTGAPRSDAVVDRVLEKTGGNPSLIVQIAHVLTHDASKAGTSAMLHTGGVKHAIAQQVAALPAPVRDALTVASVMGLSFDLVPLALALETTNDAVLALLDAAIAEGVVARDEKRTHRFTQPLVRDALYRNLADGTRMKMHARVARALMDRWGDQATAHASEIAPHLSSAAPLGDVEVALEYALCACEQAFARGDQAAGRRFVGLARGALDLARPAERGAWGSRVEAAERALSRPISPTRPVAPK